MREQVCVVGAGTMGITIAEVFATSGYRVLLCDQTIEQAEAGRQRIEKGADKRLGREKISKEQRDEIVDNIKAGTLEETGGCVYAVEAVFESIEAKKVVFEALEKNMPKDAIITTNTSSLSITLLATLLQDPTRLVGMHFFNPATLMKLVEIVVGERSDPKVVEAVEVMATKMGNTVVYSKDSAGFVVNRILVPMINEAIIVYSEGIATAEDIDKGMEKGTNHPMGPLKLADLIGLDVCLAIMDVLHRELGDSKYAPNQTLRRMVRAGHLGRKSGKGFYDYSR